MTATAGDDATLSIDGVNFARNAFVLRIEDPYDRGRRPWLYRDRNPMPRLVPFPRLARAARRAQDARQRASDALDVLRHGLPETDW